MNTAILALMTHTPLHAGSGQDMGVIDLPIQREKITAWPCVYGSSMKGALRCHAETKLDSESVQLIYGPDTEAANKEKGGYAGALNVGDARLLLFPVRSLQGTFRWLCCPANIERLLRDLDYLDLKFDNVPNLSQLQIKGLNAKHYSDKAETIYLEEYAFSATGDKKELKNLIELLTKFVNNRTDFQQQLEEKLLLISDTQFKYLVQHATPVQAHNVLDEQKASQNLWYEESLAPETLLYAPLQASDVRKKDNDNKADWVLGQVQDMFERPWLQIGGNETVGMGWCYVSLLSQAQGGA